MKVIRHILAYEVKDLFRSAWLIVYAAFYALLTAGLLYYGGGGRAAVLSLINVILTLIPLVGLLYGTMYLYASRNFIELLLSQPVSRGSLFRGMYGGLALPLAAAFAVGVIVPVAMFWSTIEDAGSLLLTIVSAGVSLTFVFVAVAFVIANVVEDRVRGMSVAIIIWLGATVLYDGLILYVVNVFSEYPLEIPVLVLALLNPVDLARIILLLNFDISALMGYTGAVFERFFGTWLGIGLSSLALLVWLGVPLLLGLRRFRVKDF